MGVALLLGVASCKPSEKSYREAYERTIDARRGAESEYLDSAALAAMQMQGRPQTLIVGADTLHYRVVRVSPARDAGSDAAPGRFCVVTGRFRQIFNAKEMRQRLIAAGYDGALIVRSAEPAYYVAAISVETPEEALSGLRKVADDARLGVKSPFPWVLTPANRTF